MVNLLCLQLKRIGDAVLTAPALAALREAHPAAHLTLVLHGPSGGLGPALAAVDETLVYRPGQANLGLWARIISGHWSACYDFTGTDRSALMARLSRATRVLGYRKFVEKKSWRVAGYTELSDASVRDLHTVDFFCALTGRPAPAEPGWRGSEALPGRVLAALSPEAEAALAGGFVVVHPGSAREEKLWPAARWAVVIAHVHQRHGLPLMLTGSAEAGEQAHLADIKAALTGSPRLFDLSGRLELLELAAVIARARLVLSVDSAAMHLAAMARRPQAALFGPTNPFHWRPRHPQARVLTAGGDTVFAPRHHPHPMTALDTAPVLAALDDALAESGSEPG